MRSERRRPLPAMEVQDTMNRSVVVSVALVALVALVSAAPSASAEEPKLIKCEITYSLKGWSAFYKTSKGEGTITCDNGESIPVKIKATGGGLTFGKSEIFQGHGTFSDVKSTADLLGSYATAEAHGAAVKGGSAQAMTKGEVSLALAGKGAGVDIGIAFGKFTLTRK